MCCTDGWQRKGDPMKSGIMLLKLQKKGAVKEGFSSRWRQISKISRIPLIPLMSSEKQVLPRCIPDMTIGTKLFWWADVEACYLSLIADNAESIFFSVVTYMSEMSWCNDMLSTANVPPVNKWHSWKTPSKNNLSHMTWSWFSSQSRAFFQWTADKQPIIP